MCHSSWAKQDVMSSFVGLGMLRHRSRIDLEENAVRQQSPHRWKRGWGKGFRNSAGGEKGDSVALLG